MLEPLFTSGARCSNNRVCTAVYTTTLRVLALRSIATKARILHWRLSLKTRRNEYPILNILQNPPNYNTQPAYQQAPNARCARKKAKRQMTQKQMLILSSAALIKSRERLDVVLRVLKSRTTTTKNKITTLDAELQTLYERRKAQKKKKDEELTPAIISNIIVERMNKEINGSVLRDCSEQ